MLARDARAASGCRFLSEFSQRIAEASVVLDGGCSRAVSGERANVVGVETLEGKGSRTKAVFTISGITCVGNKVRNAHGNHLHA